MATKTLTRSMTYAQLVTAIGAGTLNKGESITITDFATVHYVPDGNIDICLDIELNPIIKTADIEPLTIKALSSNTISNIATSEFYPNDIIHYDWNPINWIYDIGFAGWDEEVLTGFKGVIYFRHDTFCNVSMNYDFRNVVFRRWKGVGFSDTDTFLSEYQISRITGAVDVLDFIDTKTFNCTESQYLLRVRNTHFEQYRESNDQYYFYCTILLNNVFHLSSTQLWWSGHEIMNNKFGASCHANTFNGETRDNIVANEFIRNICGMAFIENEISNWCIDNVFGNYFYGNIAGEGLNNNYFGNDVEFNSFGIMVANNEFNGSFYFNTIHNDVQYLKTAVKAYENKFGNNTIYSGIKGTSGSLLDFTSASHVFNDYNCEIFKRQDGTIRLKYIDNNDSDVVVAYNA